MSCTPENRASVTSQRLPDTKFNSPPGFEPLSKSSSVVLTQNTYELMGYFILI